MGAEEAPEAVDETPLGDHEETLEVTGLPSGLDQQSVQEMFEVHGPVAEGKLLETEEKGQSAALVRFKNIRHAKSVKEKLDNGKVEGCSVPISIQFAVEKRRLLQKKAEEAAKKEEAERKKKEAELKKEEARLE